MRLHEVKSTPNGNKCLEVTNGKPFSLGLGESWVPSLTSMTDESGAEPAEQTAALCRAEGVQAVTVQR